MTLIKSISGIRGTIGGRAGDTLNPLDIVKFVSAYATLIRKTDKIGTNKIVVGRDARISGEMVKNVVCGTLMGMGFDVVNIGLATTPTTELAVTMEKACGGIILTASHNPRQWNALKLLNSDGEFLNAAEGAEVLRIVAAEDFEYADVDGTYVGIDVDILAAIAANQGFEYELEPLGFNAALQAVQSGQSDGMIAGMSITDERKEVFDFSDPYYDSTVCCAALASGDIASLDDLAGKTVAVKTGTMSESWALSIQDQYGFTTVQFDDSDVMYQDVIAGNSVACFEDTPIMAYAIATGNVDLKLVAEVESDSEYATPYGFAVKKGENAELLAAFNAGLAAIMEDGTYNEILEKYVATA